MEFTPRSVLIPLAGPGNDAGRAIAEVRADAMAPVRDAADFDPQLAQLFDWDGLYQAGMNAAAAVRRIRLGRAGIGKVLSWRQSTLPGYLSVANSDAIDGLDPTQSQSAELGMALALAAFAGQSKSRAIVATGRLQTSAKLGQADGRVVDVHPVGELSRKIEALRRYAADGSVLPNERVCFLLPLRTLDDRSIQEAHGSELKRLQAAFIARGTELSVEPVATLNEAVTKIGVRGLETTARDRIIVGLSLFAAIATVLGLSWSLWLRAPIALSFSDVVLANGTRIASPVRTTFDTAQNAFVMRSECLGAQAIPVYRNGEGLVLRTAIARPSSFARLLGGYHHLIVAVSEKSGVHVLPPEAFGRAVIPQGKSASIDAPKAGEWSIGVAIPIEGPAERTKIFVLARLSMPFDAARIRARVADVIATKPETERLNTATAFLSRAAPGYVDYTFRTTEGTDTCSPN